LGWYRFALQFVEGRRVLDVGCGLGEGTRILQRNANVAHGQDLDERLQAPGRVIGPLHAIETSSYDVVVTIDVIEHVDDPVQFLKDCARIARLGIFLSTPNWTASRCQWPYHLREYTPQQFLTLLDPFGRVRLFKGSCSGDEAYEVKYPRAQFFLNSVRNWPPTYFPSRALNRILPRNCRIHPSNAAWVSLS
jgi:SAM-dependent methyltransferase